MNELNPIKNRYEFVLLFDVTNGNPNGDPDCDNMPRVDNETNEGIVTDVCIKRKIRAAVETLKDSVPGFRMYISKGQTLNSKDKEACEAAGTTAKDLESAAKKDPDLDKKLMGYMCRTFYDIRTFGAVMTTFSKRPCSNVRGPIQLGFAKSVDPISAQQITLTRVAITKEEDANKNTEMGHKWIVPYGLYRMHGYISANDAAKTGFSEEDLDIFWNAVLNMFEYDRSAARGDMAVRALIVFKHDSVLGRTQAWKLFEKVRVAKKPDVVTPRCFDDYVVTVAEEELPSGVECIRME